MSSNIEWIVGPVHTGKTTRLTARIAKSPDEYCGMLAPVDETGKRYLQDIVSGERRMLDCSPDASDAVTVGPFIFSGKVFAWGRSILLAHNETYPERILVIDEIGKLELRGEGLADACWEMIQRRNNMNFSILLVVRETLLKSVKQKVEY